MKTHFSKITLPKRAQKILQIVMDLISESMLLGMVMLMGMAFLATISEIPKEQLRLLLYDHCFEFLSLILIIALVKSFVDWLIIVPTATIRHPVQGVDHDSQ